MTFERPEEGNDIDPVAEDRKVFQSAWRSGLAILLIVLTLVLISR